MQHVSRPKSAIQAHTSGTRTIVIGGSIAGLLAARVLAEYFGQVTILERDTLPETITVRKGVPQGAHAHALLAGGQQVIERLFPGITQALLDQGAVRGYGRFFSGGGYHYPYRFGGGGVFVSRPRLEAEVRARLLALPQVQLVERCAVGGLHMDAANARVIGVRTATQHDDQPGSIMPAELVIDASGRGSRMPAWLAALGYPRPDVEVVELNMGYSTRLYQRRADQLNGDVFVSLAATPANTRAAGMLAQEGDRWIVTLAGYFGDLPPTDEQGFVEFARSLATPDIFETIRDATALGAIVPFRFPSNQRLHYERLARFPEGLLVCGDALCSVSPLYGQGMTIAALEAAALGECLAVGREQLAQRFFMRASTIIDAAWAITAGNDRSLAGQKPRKIHERLLGWYMDRLQIAARYDPEVALAFLGVTNFLAQPLSVLRPRTVWRVLCGNLYHMRRGRLGQGRPDAQP